MVNGIDSFHPDEITAQRASEMAREALLQLTESEARLSELVGAYLGEVLRRNHDWQWGTYEFLGARTMAVTQPEQIRGQAKVCPANWVRGRMLDGSDQPFATEFRQ